LYGDCPLSQDALIPSVKSLDVTRHRASCIRQLPDRYRRKSWFLPTFSRGAVGAITRIRLIATSDHFNRIIRFCYSRRRSEHLEESKTRLTAESLARRQSDIDREVDLNSMNNFSSAQFGLQVRKQHHRILRTQRISLLSGLIAALAVPAILNAASLSLNPIKIAKDHGAVVLAEQSTKPAPKARVNVDSNGVILKGYDPVAYFTQH
jgi:hypothetical protein